MSGNWGTNRYYATLRDGRTVLVYADTIALARHEAERRWGRVATIAPATGGL